MAGIPNATVNKDILGPEDKWFLPEGPFSQSSFNSISPKQVHTMPTTCPRA